MITDVKRRASHRSKILQGQLKGLEKMIEKEEYCLDILTQSLAIQKSLASLDKLILENHIRTHVKDDFNSGDDKRRERATQELLDVYKLTSVRANNK